MYYSFRDVINKQKKKDFNVPPKEVVYELNSRLPKGLSYEKIGDILMLHQKGELKEEFKVITENMIPVNVPKRLKTGGIGDILKYAYNTQKKIKFISKGENSIKFCNKNDKTIPLGYGPQGMIQFENGEIILKTSGFKEIELNLSTQDEITHRIKVIQKKSDSEYIYRFESIDDHDLRLVMVFDENKHSMKLSIALTLSGYYTINNILKFLKLQRSFLDKSLRINDIPFNTDGDIYDNNINLQKLNFTIKWWEAIKKIDEIIGSEMKLKIPVTKKDENELFRLYVGLVIHEPFRENVHINSDIKCTVEQDFDKSLICGKDVSFSILSPVDLKRYGIEDEIYCISHLKDISIIDVKKGKKDKEKILKVDRDNSTKTYCIYQYEVSKEEAKKAINNKEKNAKYLKDFKID